MSQAGLKVARNPMMTIGSSGLKSALILDLLFFTSLEMLLKNIFCYLRIDNKYGESDTSREVRCVF